MLLAPSETPREVSCNDQSLPSFSCHFSIGYLLEKNIDIGTKNVSDWELLLVEGCGKLQGRTVLLSAICIRMLLIEAKKGLSGKRVEICN